MSDADVLSVDRGPAHLLEGVYGLPASFEDVPLVTYAIAAERIVLVDTGVATDARRRLQAGLAAMGAQARDVETVINTHAHHDHMGGNAAVRELGGAPTIAVHRADAGWAEDSTRYVAQLFRGSFPGVWEPSEAYERRMLALCGGPSTVDIRLEDGDVIDVAQDRRLVVHWTPAHSPGHVVLHDAERRLVFAGDAVQRSGVRRMSNRWMFPYYASVPVYRRSLATLRAMDAEVMLTGHYGPLDHAEAREALAESEAFIGELDALLLDALRRNRALSLAEAVTATLGQWPQYELNFQVHGTVAAHLDEMVRVGVAAPSQEGTVKRWMLC